MISAYILKLTVCICRTSVFSCSIASREALSCSIFWRMSFACSVRASATSAGVSKEIRRCLISSREKPFFIVVLQGTDGDAHFPGCFADCHKSCRYCPIFCHDRLPPDMYYKSLRSVTNKAFLENFQGGRDFGAFHGWVKAQLLLGRMLYFLKKRYGIFVKM